MILFSVLALRVVTDADDYFGAVGDVSGVSVGKEAEWSPLLTELDFSVKKISLGRTQTWPALAGVHWSVPKSTSPLVGFCFHHCQQQLGKGGSLLFFLTHRRPK